VFGFLFENENFDLNQTQKNKTKNNKYKIRMANLSQDYVTIKADMAKKTRGRELYGLANINAVRATRPTWSYIALNDELDRQWKQLTPEAQEQFYKDMESVNQEEEVKHKQEEVSEKPQKDPGKSVRDDLTAAFEEYRMTFSNDPKTGLPPPLTMTQVIKTLPSNSELKEIAKERREELKRGLLRMIVDKLESAICRCGSTSVQLRLEDYVDGPEIFVHAMEDLMVDFDKAKDFHFYITKAAEFVYDICL